MASVLVQLNHSQGLVTISANEDGEMCELHLQWRACENNLEGFYVVENTFTSLLLRTGLFIPVSDLAAEIFLQECVRGICRVLETMNVEYTTDQGVRLSRPAFLPLSVTEDDDIDEFVEEQELLSTVWGEYSRDGKLSEQHIDNARKFGVLYDFISLLNFERFILVSQLERGQ
jgi:hypothetical protein